MKKVFAAAALMAAMAAPTFADVKVDDILVNQSAPTMEGTNIRVRMSNDGAMMEKLTTVTLEVRENESAPWRTIKTWDRPMQIPAGHNLALDFLPLADGHLDTALQSNSYQLRAVVNGNSGSVASDTFRHDAMFDIDAAGR